jgi:hypothetical protein
MKAAGENIDRADRAVEKLKRVYVAALAQGELKVRTSLRGDKEPSSTVPDPDEQPKLSESAARISEYLKSRDTIPTYDIICADLHMGRSTVSNAKRELMACGRWPSLATALVGLK